VTTALAEAHARLAPSSAHIWAGNGVAGTGCAASVAMRDLYPEPDDTDEAREGTAAHHYVAELLHGRDVAPGSAAPNGVPIDAEMVDCAQGLLIDVRDTYHAQVGLGGTPQMYVETRVHMPMVHPENWGTPDVHMVDPVRKRLFVWDYKYGHRFVDAVGNLQLIDYAIGCLQTHGVPVADWPHWTVHIAIAQPRNYHRFGPIRTWQTDGRALLDVYVPLLRAAAAAAMAPEPAYQTGPHCLDCSARHACPALQQTGALAIDISLRSAPVDLPPHALGLELRQIDDALQRLKARQTGLEEQAIGLIRSGTMVPFFTAQHSVGRERWTVPPAEAFALGDLFGVDLRKPPEPITPNKARALGIDEAVISAYAERPRGAVRLERATDHAAALAFQ
jgi:hypothetical protein